MGQLRIAAAAGVTAVEQPRPHPELVVQLTVEELGRVIRAIVRDEVESITRAQPSGAKPMTITEVAEKCGCSTRTVHRLLAERRLIGHRVGHRVLISPAAVDCLIEQSARRR